MIKIFMNVLLLVLIFASTSFCQEFKVDRAIEYTTNLEDAETMLYILDLDIVKYFNIPLENDSEAALKEFKKSSEYKEKFEQLSAIKKETIETEYLTTQYNWNYDYDAKAGVYNIEVSDNYYSNSYFTAPKTINRIHFPKLPTKWININNDYVIKGAKKEVLPIKVDKKTADIIDQNKSDIYVFFIFKPTGTIKLKYKLLNESFGEVKSENYEEKLVAANKVRLVVFNHKTDEIYFDKEYK